MTNVVCIKTGNLYGPEYVNKLYNMVKRNTIFDFRFVCFTDNQQGLDSAVEARPLPYALRGWWAKVPLFGPPDCIADDQIVALDVDIVIINNIDWLINWRGDFAICYDWRGSKYYNGGLWSLKPGMHTHVWTKFQACGDEVMRTYYSDQEWIKEQVPEAQGIQTLFPGKVLGFNQHYWNVAQPVFNPLASIYLFHGFPKPGEVWKKVDWVREHWR